LSEQGDFIEITRVQKNSREQIVVGINTYRGVTFADVRIYYEKTNGEWAPTGKGVGMRREQALAVILGLQDAVQRLGATDGEPG